MPAAYQQAKENLHRFRSEPTIWTWLFFWQSCRARRDWRVQVSASLLDAKRVSHLSVRSAVEATQDQLLALEQLIRRVLQSRQLTQLPPHFSSHAGYHGMREEGPVKRQKLVRRRDGVDGHVPIQLFQEASNWARAVVRLSCIPDVSNGDTITATGFLISDRLIATCAHSIPTFEAAAHPLVVVEFDQYDAVPERQRQKARLRPDHCFWTRLSADHTVDITIVAFEYIVDPAASANNPSVAAPRPFIPLRGSFDGRKNKKDADNLTVILDHPLGLELSATVGRTHGSISDFSRVQIIGYDNDTDDGSSGAPVFNFAWQLIAVHHGGGSRWNWGTTCTIIVALLQDDRRRAAAEIQTSRKAAYRWALLDECRVGGATV